MIPPKPNDPTRARPEEVERAAQIEALVQATDQLLVEHGNDGFSTLRIASRANVPIGVLLQLFGGKEALVAAARERRRAAARAASAPASTVTAARAPASAAASRPLPAPPPASALFRPPATAREPSAAPTFVPPRSPQTSEPAPAARAAAVPQAARVSQPAGAPAAPLAPQAPAAPQVPPAPRAATETLQDELTVLIRRLVSTLAEHLPSVASTSTAEREAIHRAELKRLATDGQAVLSRHRVPLAGHAAHVMTLACDKVIKDALRNAPESFSDGRLEQALVRLCLDFVQPGQG